VKANAELRRQMEQYGWSGYREAFDRTSDISTLTAFTEDTVALIGLVVALIGIFASRFTENPVYDAAGAIVIGILLMAFAVLLAIENKRLILGESLEKSAEADLRKIVADGDGILGVDDLQTTFVGPQKVLVTGDVRFETDLSPAEVDLAIEDVETALREADDRVTFVYIEPAD
jgi:divalent metal cation (Fe/Co/Zn/Cd) transporter